MVLISIFATLNLTIPAHHARLITVFLQVHYLNNQGYPVWKKY